MRDLIVPKPVKVRNLSQVHRCSWRGVRLQPCLCQLTSEDRYLEDAGDWIQAARPVWRRRLVPTNAVEALTADLPNTHVEMARSRDARRLRDGRRRPPSSPGERSSVRHVLEPSRMLCSLDRPSVEPRGGSLRPRHRRALPLRRLQPPVLVCATAGRLGARNVQVLFEGRQP